ncbi:MAG: polymer-forming cytoskeletal protein [Desulfovibrio sp.]|nr:polymer-forming cytoskeletal protein [Desulfovibrio sp.]
MAKDEIAYLGSDTVYEGKLSFKGTVRIEGRFTGEIASEGSLNVGKEAKVNGNLAVGELLLSGHFTGDAIVKKRAVIYSSGIYEGNLQTPVLITEEGAVIEGQISMVSSGKVPQKNARAALEG